MLHGDAFGRCDPNAYELHPQRDVELSQQRQDPWDGTEGCAGQAVRSCCKKTAKMGAQLSIKRIPAWKVLGWGLYRVLSTHEYISGSVTEVIEKHQ